MENENYSSCIFVVNSDLHVFPLVLRILSNSPLTLGYFRFQVIKSPLSYSSPTPLSLYAAHFILLTKPSSPDARFSSPINPLLVKETLVCFLSPTDAARGLLVPSKKKMRPMVPPPKLWVSTNPGTEPDVLIVLLLVGNSDAVAQMFGFGIFSMFLFFFFKDGRSIYFFLVLMFTSMPYGYIAIFDRKCPYSFCLVHIEF